MTASSLESHQWRAIAQLSCELAEAPGYDVDGGLVRLLDWLCDTTHACEAFVVLAKREETSPRNAAPDPLSGWRPCRTIYHRQPPERIEVRRAYYAHAPRYIFDPKTQALARTTGRSRAFLRRELVDDATWSRCPQVNELWPALGLGDRLTGVVAVDPRVEVLFVVERSASDKAFAAQERDIMSAVMERASWFHRRVAWSHGLLSASGMLAPREREILAHLLSAQGEKQIAASLGLTERSTHQYVVKLYRKLGVSSRAELFACFVCGDRALAPNAVRLRPHFPIPTVPILDAEASARMNAKR